jgi:ABC-type Zn uptake system ZnuABC Zn-binding protein ZnuA
MTHGAINDAESRRKRTQLRNAWLFALALLILSASAECQDKIQVVATLPTYAAIARELTGELADVEAIARGDQDPHFVNPRPSFAAMVQHADLFIATGLDLELWVPAIMDRANNPKVREGAAGNVVAYAGVKLLQVPENVSRTGGDVHVFGNPHVHTDPVNAILVARNIVARLKRVDPANAATYEANLSEFENRVMSRLFGDELLELLGAETIFDLARSYEFWDFASTNTYQGKPLTEYLGGWLGQAKPFRNQRMVCYHKNWAYLSARFRIECAMYVEPKPGIPASPGHVADVIEFMETENIPVLFAANYFSRSQVERVATRAGVKPLMVPEHVAGEEGVDDYWALVDLWITHLANAFQDWRPGHP